MVSQPAMATAAPSDTQQRVRRQLMPGTLPAWRMAERLVKILQVSVRGTLANYTLPIYEILTVTRFARCIEWAEVGNGAMIAVVPWSWRAMRISMM